MLAGKSRSIKDEEIEGEEDHEDLNVQIREFFWNIICNDSVEKEKYKNEQIEFAIKKYSDLIKDQSLKNFKKFFEDIK